MSLQLEESLDGHSEEGSKDAVVCGDADFLDANVAVYAHSLRNAGFSVHIGELALYCTNKFLSEIILSLKLEYCMHLTECFLVQQIHHPQLENCFC